MIFVFSILFRSTGKSQGSQRILGDCRKLPLCHLGIFWNRRKYSVLLHRVYLSCLPNDFGHRKQKQGRRCSVVGLLGVVFILFFNRNVPRLYPILDSILFRFQVSVFVMGDVTPNSWRKVPLRQFPERLFKEEF